MGMMVQHVLADTCGAATLENHAAAGAGMKTLGNLSHILLSKSDEHTACLRRAQALTTN